MTCHTPRTADIVTYRYHDKLVYVPVAPNYMQALSHAREAFPQLKKLRDASLSLSLVAPGHAQQFVGISAPAWPRLIAHMSRYQIIDVHVAQPCSEGGRECGRVRDATPAPPIPDITITYADTDETEPVPPYRRSEDVADEKASYASPSPSPSPSLSPSPIHPARRSWFFQKLHGNVFNAS